MKNRISITSMLVFLSLIVCMACSNDDDNNNNGNEPSNNLNKISFDISGYVDGNKTGGSYVVIVEDYNTYMISSHDGTSNTNQTFSLNFYKDFEDTSTENPAPGTYPIGTVVDLVDQDGFWLVYTDTQNNIEFGSGTDNVSGTLTITSNTNNLLKGTFEFTATKNQTGESIQVTNGQFSAAID